MLQSIDVAVISTDIELALLVESKGGNMNACSRKFTVGSVHTIIPQRPNPPRPVISVDVGTYEVRECGTSINETPGYGIPEGVVIFPDWERESGLIAS
jgi:hypothetical protein